MQASSLVFVAIVVGWLVYLLPQWVRRRDALGAARAPDRHSEGLRVLPRRSRTTGGPSSSPLLTPARGVTILVDDEDDQENGFLYVPATPAPAAERPVTVHAAATVPARVSEPVAGPVAEPVAERLAESREPVRSAPDPVDGSPSRPAVAPVAFRGSRPARHVGGGTQAGAGAGAAANAEAVAPPRAAVTTAARRRVRVLALLVVVTVTAWASATFGAGSTAVAWACTGALAVYLVALRAAARRRAPGRVPVPVAAPAPVPAARPTRPAVVRRPGADDETIELPAVPAVPAVPAAVSGRTGAVGEPAAVDERVIDLTAVEARQGGWLPVPVPPPTYTLKAKAPRPAPPPLEEEPVAEPVAAWAQPSEPEDAGRPLDLDEVLARRRAVNG